MSADFGGGVVPSRVPASGVKSTYGPHKPGTPDQPTRRTALGQVTVNKTTSPGILSKIKSLFSSQSAPSAPPPPRTIQAKRLSIKEAGSIQARTPLPRGMKVKASRMLFSDAERKEFALRSLLENSAKESNTELFRKLLQNPEGLKVLQTWGEKSYNTENITFLQAVKDFEELCKDEKPDLSAIRQGYEEIVKNFIAKDATKQINIDERTSTSIRNYKSKLDVNPEEWSKIFAGAEHIVITTSVNQESYKAVIQGLKKEYGIE